MGEIDTKPIEPVQVALTLFGEKSDQKRHRTISGSSSSSEEMEKEKDVEVLLKDLANYKVQLEAKESAYLQLLHKLEYYQKTCQEISVQLTDSEATKDVYIEELGVAKLWVAELESKMKEMSDKLVETGKLREQLSHVLSELRATQGELLTRETELAAADDAKLKALTQAELMEVAVNMENERAEELLKEVAELNEAIALLKLDAKEKENEKSAAAQEQVEDMERQLKMMRGLENQLLAKSILIDSLQVELNQANELLGSSDKTVSDAFDEMDQLKAGLKSKEKDNSDQKFYIKTLETELVCLKMELQNANDEADRLKSNVEMLTQELKKVTTEMNELKEAENEAQVEVALLQAELHKARSKLAAAEAAKVRAGRVKSGLYLAVQQPAIEAEEAKKESERPRQEADKQDSNDLGLEDASESYKDALESIESFQTEEIKAEAEERRDDNDGKITISVEEYESLMRKAAEKADQSPLQDESTAKLLSYELEIVKKELEIATAKIAEFRTRTEQAVTRAEFAEKAKSGLENEIRRWREHKQRRKAALAALRQESHSRDFTTTPSSSITNNNNTQQSHKTYQPLGKVLNMKF